jgi:hypothetical protein
LACERVGFLSYREQFSAQTIGLRMADDGHTLLHCGNDCSAIDFGSTFGVSWGNSLVGSNISTAYSTLR